MSPDQKRQTTAILEKPMAESQTRGGSHEQHVKAGEQSHKTAQSTHGSHSAETDTHGKTGQKAPAGTQGGTHEQHVKAGQQSHKNG